MGAGAGPGLRGSLSGLGSAEAGFAGRWWGEHLGREDPLEEELATHSSILAWRIPWTEENGGLWPMGLQRVGHDLVTEHTGVYLSKSLWY